MEKVIDISQLEDLGGGSREFIAEMLQMYLEQVPAALDELNHAFSTGDFASAAAVSHRIKANFTYIGMQQISDSLSRIETMCKNQPGDNAIYEAFKQIEPIINHAMEDIRVELRALAA